MNIEQTKVYCGQCRWYKYHMSQGGGEFGPCQPGREECNHARNIQWVDTHRGRHKDKAWTPSDKNAANDCALYEPKPPKQGLLKRLISALTETKLDRPRGNYGDVEGEGGK